MLFEKVLLGITLSAPIGPVSLEMIKRGLHHGFLSAFIVRLGGALGNTLCLIAAYYGISFLGDSTLLTGICGVGGAIVLIYLGMKSLLDKRVFSFGDNSASTHLNNGLLTGFLLSIANPIGIVFWLSIFAATIDPLQQSGTGLVQNFAIIAGVLLWGACLSGMLEVGKRFFNQKLISTITTIAGLMLIGFGIKYGIKGIIVLMDFFG